MTSKVVMKGFPPRFRTPQCFLVLAGGAPPERRHEHAWEEIPGEWMTRKEAGADPVREAERGFMCKPCGALRWQQLEKVRSLAALGFTRGPRMRWVTKSILTPYDGRIFAGNGGSSEPAEVEETSPLIEDDSP